MQEVRQTSPEPGTAGEEVGQLWDAALEIVRGKLNDVTFRTWFRHAEPLALDGDLLVVGAPNSFGRDWLEQYHTGLLATTLTQVAGRPLCVRFVVSGDGAPAPVPEIPADPVPVEPVVMPSPEAVEAHRVAQASSGDFQSRFTFDTFVVGESNRFAYHMALAVAEAPGSTPYNPLFIYGGVGLGKTHLMQAIGHYVREHFSHMKVRYVTVEQMVTDYVETIRTKRDQMDAFRARYRENDVLLVDDVQFLMKKEASQDEFFHTFNELHQHGRQIVIASDRAPKDLVPLSDRLISRFNQTGPVDIQPPDLETRLAILRARVADDGIPVADEVLTLIAERASSNIRELEGSLAKVKAWAQLSKRPSVDLELAERVLKDTLSEHAVKPIPVATIQNEVGRYYQITIGEMVGSKRSQNIVYPRQIAMYLTRDMTDLSLPQIGAEFGGRDHTTVMHACAKIAKLLSERRDVYNEVQALTSTIRQKV